MAICEKTYAIDAVTAVRTSVLKRLQRKEQEYDALAAEHTLLVQALVETREAATASVLVLDRFDTPDRAMRRAFVEELQRVGVVDGFGVRADAVILRIEGRTR